MTIEKGRPGQTAIYAISDCSGVVRYIGKANNPRKRWFQHRADRHRRRYPVQHWLYRELDAGRTVNFTVLEWVPDTDWEQAERRLIAAHRNSGKLLNISAGGTGGRPEPRPANLSAIARRLRTIKIMFAKYQRSLPPEAQERLRLRMLEKLKDSVQRDPDFANSVKSLGVFI